jgi:hypothetical protein
MILHGTRFGRHGHETKAAPIFSLLEMERKLNWSLLSIYKSRTTCEQVIQETLAGSLLYYMCLAIGMKRNTTFTVSLSEWFLNLD